LHAKRSKKKDLRAIETPKSGHSDVAQGDRPIRSAKSEVKLKLAWSADARTRKAIERQTKLMGFANPSDYLRQTIAATLAGD
jgi:hypothetical protein